jgi:hypothetical protein
VASKPAEEKPKPVFSFGAVPKPDDKPTSATPSTTPAATPSSKPSFSFGTVPKADDTKPTASAAVATPKFNFGAPPTEVKAVTPNPFGVGVKPAAAAGAAANPFGVGVKPVAAAAAGDDGEGEANEGEAQQEEEEEPTVVKGQDLPADHTVQIEVRTAVLELVGGAWADKGIGAMKVIAAPSFAYLLVRADGVGRVIVNARLHAKLNVTRPKPNVVALVLVGSDGAPHSYTFRVKTADLAGSLVAALEKAKLVGTDGAAAAAATPTPVVAAAKPPTSVPATTAAASTATIAAKPPTPVVAAKVPTPTPVVAATAAKAATPAAAAAVTPAGGDSSPKLSKGQRRRLRKQQQKQQAQSMDEDDDGDDDGDDDDVEEVEAPTKAAEKRKQAEPDEPTTRRNFRGGCGGDEWRRGVASGKARRCGDDDRVSTVVWSIDQRHRCDGQSRCCRRCGSVAVPIRRLCGARAAGVDSDRRYGAQRRLCDAGSDAQCCVYDARGFAQHSVGAGDTRFTADGNERLGACGDGGGANG